MFCWDVTKLAKQEVKRRLNDRKRMEETKKIVAKNVSDESRAKQREKERERGKMRT